VKLDMRPPRGPNRKTRKLTTESVHSVHVYILNHGDDSGYKPPSVAEPTGELPGSKRKLEVLRTRVDRGEHLWNSEDITPE